MRKGVMLFAAVVLTITTISVVNAASPSLVNYQGILTDPGGTPQVGTFNVSFALYSTPIGGSPLWSESQSVTTNADGLFNVLLGSSTPLTDVYFVGTDRYLGVAVSPDGEMIPRTQITSVGYSHRVGTVDSASGGTITSKISIGPGHTNSGAEGFVAGRGSNLTGDYATISGGLENAAEAELSTVGGGGKNYARGSFSTIAGGGGFNDLDSNSASGEASTISGGYSNTASGQASTVGGGVVNSSTAEATTVGGGSGNIASGLGSTVGGGANNKARGQFSAIAGGGGKTVSLKDGFAADADSNLALGDYSAIGGGKSNIADGAASTIAGGESNQTSANYATVGGGLSNKAINLGVVAGGVFNEANGLGAIGGGLENTAYDQSAVGGGAYNFARGNSSFIGSGRYNRTRGEFSVIGGGGSISDADSNWAIGTATFIGGGRQNSVNGELASLVGGLSNAAAGNYAHVGGGANNRAVGNYSVVAGGGSIFVADSNVAEGEISVIGGGAHNRTRHPRTVVAGGYQNSALINNATVSGGSLNTAGPDVFGFGSMTIAGGVLNTALGSYAAISGGRENSASNLYATIPEGFSNDASGVGSFAAGNNSNALHDGAFVWSDQSFTNGATSTGINQFVARAAGGFYLYTDLGSTTGVTVAPGDGSWSSVSDRNLKENVRSIDSEGLLEKLSQIPISEWNYTSQNESVRHIGPMAQDFRAAFGLGSDDKHISTIDADGIALAAIQALHAKTKEIDVLRTQIAELKAQMQSLAGNQLKR